MAKPPSLFPSDDCAVTIGGTVYYPHEGEWIKTLPGLSVSEMLSLSRLQHLHTAMLAAKGDADEAEKTQALLEETFDGICSFVAARMIDWNWTDNASQPMGSPKDPEVLKSLSNEELSYLVDVVKGEVPTAKKNGSARSVTTLSVSTSPAVASRSNGGRSRLKVS